MRLYKLLIKDDGESCPMAVGIYSDIATANRAKELCPGSYLMNLPLDYIPKGCPEGMLAWVVNVDCSEGLVTSEQIDVFSVKGGFAPSEHYYLSLWEDPGEICVAMWAKSKEEAEAHALYLYERFKESFPHNRKGFFAKEEWDALLRDQRLHREVVDG